MAPVHGKLQSPAAAELRLSTRQVYNLLVRYRTARTVAALLPRTAETRRKRLPANVEEIISTALREQWLTLGAPPLAPVVAEIRARCEETGLAQPSYVTIARRIPALFAPEEIARKRSANPKHLPRFKRMHPGEAALLRSERNWMICLYGRQYRRCNSDGRNDRGPAASQPDGDCRQWAASPFQ